MVDTLLLFSELHLRIVLQDTRSGSTSAPAAPTQFQASFLSLSAALSAFWASLALDRRVGGVHNVLCAAAGHPLAAYCVRQAHCWAVCTQHVIGSLKQVA